MKFYKIGLFVLLICLLACQQAPNNASSKKEREVQQYSIDQFMDTEAITGASLSNDKSKVLISSNRSGIYNLYEIPIDGGAATALSQSDTTSLFAISYFPNDDRILFSMDNNGDEISHLYVRTPEGEITEITPDKGAKASFFGWAHDGKSFFYGYTKRDPRVLQVESDEIVEAVRANGVPVEYVLFPDEGHGFIKKKNQVESYQKILEFLDKYLKEKEDIKG